VLRLSYYHGAGGSGWDRTKDHPPQSADIADYLGRRYDAPDEANECLTCHTTTARSAQEGIGPESADHAIGCEGCHGPGGLHPGAVAVQPADPAIINPTPAAAAAINRLCGRCHSQHLQEMPASLADSAWARFPGSTLPQSRCYTESGAGLSCVTCHDPHRDAETTPVVYEKKCLNCHARSKDSNRASSAETAFRTPCPVNPRRDCLQCHMPKVPNPRLHTAFTDHYIRVHAPPSSPPGGQDRPAAAIRNPRPEG
jgi:hypothetical protein